MSNVFSATVPTLEALRTYCRQLQFHAVLTGTLVLGAVALLVPYAAPSKPLLLLLFFAYLVFKTLRFDRLRRAVRQLRLEQSFIRYHTDARELHRLLPREDHLWAGSLLFRTLGPTLGMSALRILPKAERDRRFEPIFRQHFGWFRLPELNSSLLFLGLALWIMLGDLDVTGAASAPRTPPSYRLAFLFAAVAMVTEYFGVVLRQRLNEQLGVFRETLSDLLVTADFDSFFEEAGRRSYRHALLYYARPWLGGG